MRAFAYYEPIDNAQFTEHAQLVELWKASWARRGWDPVILMRRHAEAHPAWRWFSERVRSLPTVNPPEYEFACFIRWLALANEMRPGELAVFTDYDVANLAFGPMVAVQIHNPGQPVNTDVNYGSGPFVVSYAQAQAIPPVMVAVVSLLKTVYPDRTHWADMEMWKANQYGNIGWQQTVPLCLEYEPDVNASLVHITYSSAHRFNTTKLSAWKELEARCGA